MDYIKIKGYKSIREITIDLRPINILIGANGAGKSNFISFFEFLNRLYEAKLKEYVALNGGAQKMLHKGSKITDSISAHLSFGEETNGYSFELKEAEDHFIFTQETVWYGNNPWFNPHLGSEAIIKKDSTYRAKYVRNYLKKLQKYHFHDTGKDSPFTKPSNVDNDSFYLYEKGDNIAAFLYHIQKDTPLVYQRIIKIIQSIAPFFSDFYLEPNKEGNLRLQWTDKFSSITYGPTDLSDGTIRFIALATLFLQPEPPSTIIIDEPELGLHPFAISKLAGLIKGAAKRGIQIILATQSTELLNHFQPEDIITVDQIDGESIFNRLAPDELSEWLDEFSMGYLWKNNIIQGGQP